ncbi:MAG: NACHT domain-containing protein [Candidatus Ozemobacteraceae bacterium]
MARLPPVLAYPLQRYLSEQSNPVLKLWKMCEFAETFLGFYVALILNGPEAGILRERLAKSEEATDPVFSPEFECALAKLQAGDGFDWWNYPGNLVSGKSIDWSRTGGFRGDFEKTEEEARKLFLEMRKRFLKLLLPDFGSWNDLLQALTSTKKFQFGSPKVPRPVLAWELSKTVDREFPGFKEFYQVFFDPFLKSGTSENLVSHRNTLAHSGHTNRSAEAILWAGGKGGLRGKFEEKLRFLEGFGQIFLLVCVGHGPKDLRKLTGPDMVLGASWDYSGAAFDIPQPGEVFLARGNMIRKIWPFHIFSPIRQEVSAPDIKEDLIPGNTRGNESGAEAEALKSHLQIFTGCQNDGVCFHPLGNPESPINLEDKRMHWGILKFLGLKDSQRPEWSMDDLEEGAGFVGRESERQTIGNIIERWALHQEVGGIHWFTGSPGSGKSALMARVAFDWLDRNQEINVFPFFFRFGTNSPDLFLTQLWNLLSRMGLPKPLEMPVRRDDFINLIAAVLKKKEFAAGRVLFLIDGLDELERMAPGFSRSLWRMEKGDSLWLCSGRREESWEPSDSLPHTGPISFSDSSSPIGDLPRMNSADIRMMLMKGIGKRDREIPSVFVEGVMKKADGVPLYVALVVKDIIRAKAKRFPEFDPKFLPSSLNDYFAELLKRSSIGDLAQILTPLFCQLVVAYDPQTIPSLTDVLLERGLLVEGKDSFGLVKKGLEHIEGIFPLEKRIVGQGVEYALPPSLKKEFSELGNETPGMGMEMEEAINTARRAGLGKSGPAPLFQGGNQ